MPQRGAHRAVLPRKAMLSTVVPFVVAGVVLAVIAPSAAPKDQRSVGAAPASASTAVPLLNQDGSIGGLYPTDIQHAYGLENEPAGGGTVGVLAAYANPGLEADLAHYRSTFGLPPCTTAGGCLSIVDQRGGSGRPSYNGEWGEEERLDVQAVSAACPACRILVVEADGANSRDLDAAADTAVRLGADALSASYGSTESASYADRTAHYTHPGVPTFAATGDGGDPGALFPAALPGVIGVSGTKVSPIDPFSLHVNGDVFAPVDGPTPSAAPAASPRTTDTVKPLLAASGGGVAALTARLKAARAAETRAANRLVAAKRAATKAAKAVKKAHTAKARKAAKRSRAKAAARVTTLRRAAAAAAAVTRTVLRNLHAAEAAEQDAENTAPGTSAPVPVPVPVPVPSSVAVPSPLPTPSQGFTEPVPAAPPVTTPPPSSTPSPAPVDSGDWDPGTTVPEGFAGYAESAWAHGDGGCSRYVPAPAYQAGLSTGCGDKRAITDVAAMAANSLAVYDSASSGWMTIGGTSLAAPLVAAMAVRSGAAASLAADGEGAAAFSAAAARGDLADITSGGATTCFVLSSCDAGIGWDNSTGFGAPRGLGAFRG